MVDVHRYHDISESNHAILNPLSYEQMLLAGEICELRAGQRHLDLASGKGEMVCQYALRHGTRGVGVDIHPRYVDLARGPARELGVDHAVEFVHDNAATYTPEVGSFDLVSCIGASWIGGGLPGTLRLMVPPLRSNGWLLVGELFWNEKPAPAIAEALDLGQEGVQDLGGVLARFEDAQLDLVEMVIANHDTWDRYSASQWLNVSKWLDENGDDADAEEIQTRRDKGRRDYLEYERRYLGWGVFILRRS